VKRNCDLAKAAALARSDEDVRRVLPLIPARGPERADYLRRRMHRPNPPEARMWVQIVIVAIVAVVFLVRLVAALYDQPSKSRH